jgi:1-acyl-sn-glycerol-3-phosphate acyltransferase
MHEILAVAFLGSIVAILLVILVRDCRFRGYSLPQYVLFAVASLIVRLQWRASLRKDFPLRRGQGAVIVCNHRSSVDPFFFQIGIPWVMHWMVAKEYCVHPAFGWFLRQCEVIPTNRAGIDTASTKTAIRLASRGEVVGMMPEGRINVTDQLLLPARPGAALVALKAKVPLVPAYLEGSPYAGTAWSPFFMTARVRLRWGEPIDLSPYYGREHEEEVVPEIMLRCLREIAKLAGQPNFEPTLAGRQWKPVTEEFAK